MSKIRLYTKIRTTANHTVVHNNTLNIGSLEQEHPIVVCALNNFWSWMHRKPWTTSIDLPQHSNIKANHKLSNTNCSVSQSNSISFPSMFIQWVLVIVLYSLLVCFMRDASLPNPLGDPLPCSLSLRPSFALSLSPSITVSPSQYLYHS